ncbi:MAG: hypothetical protein WAK55_17820, partial [Xanthobacteraceae bacterium]
MSNKIEDDKPPMPVRRDEEGCANKTETDVQFRAVAMDKTGVAPSTEAVERRKGLRMRSQPTIARQAEDKGPHAASPDDGKPQVISEEAPSVSGQYAGKGFAVEDDNWIAFEHARSRLKWVLGIDDDDFCAGILRQLEKLTNWRYWADRSDFDFVLSVLKDANPVDKLHALLHVQMAVCHLCAMKQTELLLKPVRFELPVDFQLAIHRAKYDTRRLDKQKIRVDDLPLRQSGERAVRG